MLIKIFLQKINVNKKLLTLNLSVLLTLFIRLFAYLLTILLT